MLNQQNLQEKDRNHKFFFFFFFLFMSHEMAAYFRIIYQLNQQNLREKKNDK